MNALVAAAITVAFHGFLLRRIPPTVEWKLRALARRASLLTAALPYGMFNVLIVNIVDYKGG
jgi:hypothetical protein